VIFVVLHKAHKGKWKR